MEGTKDQEEENNMAISRTVMRSSQKLNRANKMLGKELKDLRKVLSNEKTETLEFRNAKKKVITRLLASEVKAVSEEAEDVASNPEKVVKVVVTEEAEDTASNPEMGAKVATEEVEDVAFNPEMAVKVAKVAMEEAEDVAFTQEMAVKVAKVATEEAEDVASSPEMAVKGVTEEAEDTATNPEMVAKVATDEAEDVASNPEMVVKVVTEEEEDVASNPEMAVKVVKVSMEEVVEEAFKIEDKDMGEAIIDRKEKVDTDRVTKDIKESSGHIMGNSIPMKL